MSAIRSVRTAPRLIPKAIRAPLAYTSRASFAGARIPFNKLAQFSKFSTMSPLQSGAPPPPQAREYDPEIKDIASYVHHTPINSDLAVSIHRNFQRLC